MYACSNKKKTKRKRDAVALLMLKSVARYSLCRLASLPAVTVSDCHCAQYSAHVHHNHTNANKSDTSQNKTASIYICLKSVLLFFNILQIRMIIVLERATNMLR